MRLLCIAGTLTALLLCSGGVKAAEKTNVISAVAGSGRAGLKDGPPAAAEFIMPSALAVDGSGNIFVSDAASQRIRVIRGNGFVSTIAGSGALNKSKVWVEPGYKDGPAAAAQFNRPSGLAVSRDGRLFVADTYNHCIRLIAANVVSTFAGACGTAGSSDGARRSALFAYPRQLALASDGTLYIADVGNGVRKIDPAGVVSTLALPVEKRVTGIAIRRTGDLVVADVSGLLLYNPQSGHGERIPVYYASHVLPLPLEGGVELGSPYALATGAANEIFFTDLRSDSVRYLNGRYVEYLTGTPKEDAVLGSTIEAPPVVRGPMGVAVDSHGDVLIADTGHKRIVRISAIDRTRFMRLRNLLTLNADPRDFRILIVGNSFVWFSSTAKNSLAAYVEQKLLADRALRDSGRTPRVLYTRSTIEAQPSLVKEVLSVSNIDFMIVVTNFFDWGHYFGATNWKEKYLAQEVATIDALRPARMPVLFVVTPASSEVTPLERLYERENLTSPDADFEQPEAPFLSMLQSIGPPVLSLYPEFRAYELSSGTRSLYANEDLHLSPFGRMFVGGLIAKRLETMRPWIIQKK
ncbi:MAG: hypothetical protein JO033_02585 [Acidobacteriaceae bacterium]|nr:hypothetical protein [Acidobacteriaceae bacterium]